MHFLKKENVTVEIVFDMSNSGLNWACFLDLTTDEVNQMSFSAPHREILEALNCVVTTHWEMTQARWLL